MRIQTCLQIKIVCSPGTHRLILFYFLPVPYGIVHLLVTNCCGAWLSTSTVGASDSFHFNECGLRRLGGKYTWQPSCRFFLAADSKETVIHFIFMTFIIDKFFIQDFGSGSVLDPDSIRPNIRCANKKFHVLKCRMFSFEG